MKLEPYSEYKDSGVEWIGELPKEWEINKIKYTSYVKGRIGWQGLKADEFIDEGPYLITGTNFRDGNIDWESCYHISEERYKQDPFIQVKENDIIITKDGTIGKVAFISNLPDKTSLNSHLLIIRPLYNLYYSKYLFWLLQSRVFLDYIEISKVGTTFYGITQEEVEKFKFPIPSQDEQINIEKYLDKKTSEIDLTIEKDTQLIELLKEKRTALINHVVTKGLDPKVKMKDSGVEWIGEIPEDWEVNKTKEITDVKISNVDKKSKENEPEVLLCNYTDVYNNEFITSKLDFMKATASVDQVKKLSLQKGDVIITKDSETQDDIAVPALVDEDLENVVCGYHLALIRPHNYEIIGDFLFRLLQSRKINDQFVVAANGVTRFGISTYPIKNSYLTLPPLNQQELICKYLNQQSSQIDLTIEKIGNNIELLEEYKKSLIHHVVTGKVNVLKED